LTRADFISKLEVGVWLGRRNATQFLVVAGQPALSPLKCPMLGMFGRDLGAAIELVERRDWR